MYVKHEKIKKNKKISTLVNKLLWAVSDVFYSFDLYISVYSLICTHPQERDKQDCCVTASAFSG